MNCRHFMSASVLVCLGVWNAAGAPVNVSFAGTSAGTSDPLLSPLLFFGQRVTGEFSFESTRPVDQIVLGAGNYDAVLSMSVTVSGNSWTASSPLGGPFIQIVNNSICCGDQFFIRVGGLTGPTVGGLPLRLVDIQFTDPSGTALSTALQLPAALDLNQFSQAGFTLWFGDGVAVDSPVSGALDPVPEPATLSFVALGMLGLFFNRVRLRNMKNKEPRPQL